MSEMSALQAQAKTGAQTPTPTPIPAPTAAGKLESTRAKWEQKVEPVLFAGLLGTLAWCSIPLGSNRPWPMGLLAKLLRLLPNRLYDRLLAGRGRKPRRD
jgi:hypothetical protein